MNRFTKLHISVANKNMVMDKEINFFFLFNIWRKKNNKSRW